MLLAVDGFAPIDGIGNNVDHPEWGASGEQFLRLAPAAYADGLGEPARAEKPNARDISNALAAQDESIPNDRFITSMWFFWGQFVDHDITRTFDVEPFEHTSETESFDISAVFPFNRSPYDPDTGTTTPRQHVSHVMAFLDGSVVYGFNEAHSGSLRTLAGGQMQSQGTAVANFCRSIPKV